MKIPDAPTPHTLARDPDEPVTRQQFLNLFVAVFLPMFLAAVDQTLLATATPAIAAALGGLTDTSWIAVGYLLSSAAAVPVYGRFGDRYGRREMLLVAVGIFSLGSLACGLAQSLPQLIAARVIQGLGGGGLLTVSQALIGELIRPRERARFQGYFAMVYTLASVTGPIVGGGVVSHLSWRWLFLANLPLAAFAVWRLRKLPHGQPHRRHAGSHDAVGIALFAIATVSGLYWLTSAGHHFAWGSRESVILLALSLVSLAALLRREHRHASPFLPVDLFRDKVIALSLVTTLLYASCMFAMVFFLPIYLQLGRSLSALQSGLLLFPLTAGMVVTAVTGGRYVSRTGNAKWLPVAGMALSSVVLAILGVLTPTPTAVAVLGFMTGLGFGVIMPITQVVVQVAAGSVRLGAATSMITLFRSVGAASGAALFGAIVYALMPSEDVTKLARAASEGPVPLITHAFHVAFLVTAAIAAIGAIVASRIPTVSLWQAKNLVTENALVTPDER
jgi:EmrB/QacA subfamily drug resistance transporter